MSILTILHVLLSLIGILAGLVLLSSLFRGTLPDGWNLLFLITTILTSVTGFFFPFHKLLPSHVLGVLSLIALGVALVALYGRNLSGPW